MVDKKAKIFIILFGALVAANLGLLNFWVWQEKGQLETAPAASELKLFTAQTESSPESTCDSFCLERIDRLESAISTLSGQTKVTEQKTVEKTAETIVSEPQIKTFYLPLGSSGSTTSRDWTEITGAEAYLDLADYPGVKEVTWEASLKVKHGNGQAWARLYDVTHSVSVAGSELYTDSENLVMKISSPLTLWAGKNLYRVQLKSLTGYEASLDSARIKIILN